MRDVKAFEPHKACGKTFKGFFCVAHRYERYRSGRAAQNNGVSTVNRDSAFKEQKSNSQNSLLGSLVLCLHVFRKKSFFLHFIASASPVPVCPTLRML